MTVQRVLESNAKHQSCLRGGRTGITEPGDSRRRGRSENDEASSAGSHQTKTAWPLGQCVGTAGLRCGRLGAAGPEGQQGLQ